MNKYIYNGPVFAFERCIADNWVGETYATNYKKAKNNLKYQFKKANNRATNSAISLPNEVEIVAS